MARSNGEAKVAALLRSLAPGLDPVTSATLGVSRAQDNDATSDAPWMPPRRSPAPGWIGAAARPSRRIDWSLDGADVQASSPNLHEPPFASSHPTPNVPPLGMPRSNGHGGLPPGRSVPGQIIDGGPRG